MTEDLARQIKACKEMTKPIFPMQAQCFLDMRPGGGLCHILGTAYKFKAEQGW